MKKIPRCPIHPREYATACFSCHLSQPCDEPECGTTATHNGFRRGPVANGDRWRGKFCNSHIDWDQPAFARDD